MRYNKRRCKRQAEEELELIFCSGSATDCTGLIPTLPQNEAEVEHYNELYNFLPDTALPHYHSEKE